MHQYSQAWFDFRGKRDQYTDYFQNSITATEVHRRFCMDLASQFPDYSDRSMGHHRFGFGEGIRGMGRSAGDRADRRQRGSMRRGEVRCRFFRSRPCACCETIKNRYGQRAWTRYGFVDAFNPLTNWYDSDVVGIDTGITHDDGGECAHGIRVEYVHEKSGSSARHGTRRIQSLQAIEADRD